MVLTTYNKIKSIHFTQNQIHVGQLFTEIENSNISTKLNKVFENTLDVNITFENILSTLDQTTLDTIISNHIPNNYINIQTQLSPIVLSDNNYIITTDELIKCIICITPTSNRIITLPNANLFITKTKFNYNDSIDFYIINQATNGISIITLAMGIGTNIIGDNYIQPGKSASFRLRVTNSNIGNEQYDVLRLT